MVEYVTVDGFASEYPDEPTPTKVQVDQANLAVAEVLCLAAYDVDAATGLPSDPEVLQAARTAAAWQVLAVQANDAKLASAGSHGPLTSANIGGVSYTYAQSASAPDTLAIPASGGVCPRAYRLLRVTPGLHWGVATYG